MSDVSAEHLADLNAGRAQAKTLTEALVIDHCVLLAAACPGASAELIAEVGAAQELGILKRMAAIGSALQQHLAPTELALLAEHPSDTVRGWWCFATAANEALDPAALLAECRPRADDEHFTVREWVWMALRPRLVQDLAGSVALLEPWTQDSSPSVRRFASESLRPRGVWASHIKALKEQPSLGEPLLEPLRADPERYVQDSVANWINDASKTAPDWARELCARWLTESPAAATERIVARALRSLR
ncbi:DNA alkylation repair protein [Leucobacter sp. BZR 635]